jgi:hypothetical protein
MPPETAPIDGTPILGDFGWPWANFALWDEYDEQWCIATLQASSMADGPTNSWIETDTEKRGSLKRWMPLPSLPNETSPSEGKHLEICLIQLARTAKQRDELAAMIERFAEDVAGQGDEIWAKQLRLHVRKIYSENA